MHEFIDMHDLGDMLVAAGFAAPVMDMEMIQVDYGRSAIPARRPARERPDQRARRPAAAGSAGALFAERLRAALPGAHVRGGLRPRLEGPQGEPEAKSVRVFKRMP